MGFMKLMQEGGFGMLFILLFGLAGLLAAIRYATAPSDRFQVLCTSLGRATLFSTLATLGADLGATLHALAGTRLPNIDIKAPDGVNMLLQGLGESMSPIIMGFALLALLHLFQAIGSFRAAKP
jgi:hypothetical protein